MSAMLRRERGNIGHGTQRGGGPRGYVARAKSIARAWLKTASRLDAVDYNMYVVVVGEDIFSPRPDATIFYFGNAIPTPLN